MAAPVAPAAPGRLGAALAGAAVGATAWISAGVLALTDPATMTRVGALPPWTWLAAAVLGGAAVGGLSPWRPPTLAPLALLAVLWLPWLPLEVPGIFLLWEGPIENLVWGAAVAGLLWPAVRQAMARPGRAWPPGGAMTAVALVTALAYGAAWRIDRARVPAGDEPHYLVITQSLLHDGDLRIENNHQRDDYLAYFDGVLKPDFRRRGTDRQIYSIHAPGLAVLVAPAFAVAGYPGAVLMVLVLVGLAVAVVWRTAWRLTGSSGAAWFASLAVAVSSPLVLHGFTIYPDTVGTLAVMAGVAALVECELGTRRLEWRGWLGVGAALAVLPWLHTRFVIVALALGAILLARLWTRPTPRAVGALLAVPVVSAAAWFGYFWLIYGTPNPIAPYGAREGGLAEIPRGLAGLLVDHEFGLAANAPILLAALVALVPLARTHRRLAIELGAVLAPYLLAVATYPMWWGGYSAPARFLVVVLPVLGVPLAWAWVTGGGVTRATLAALAGLSAAISVALVVHDGGSFMFNNRDGHGLLLDWLSPTVDLTLAAPSVHRDGPGLAVWDTAIWMAALAVAAALCALAGRVSGSARRLAWAVAWPLTAMAAIPVVAAGRDRPWLTASTSQVALLGRWDASPRQVALQLHPTRRLAVDEVPPRLSLVSSTRFPARSGAPLLLVPEVPAGDYDVFVDGAAPLAGTLTVKVGRQSHPLVAWDLVGRAPGFGGLVLQLPLDVHSVTIEGDGPARDAVRAVALRPRRIAPRGSAWALRAARYGGAVVYGLDDHAFLEPTALWIQGQRTARLVVSVDAGVAPVVQLRPGPVANVVTLSAGTWVETVRLAPGEPVDVRLPAEALAPAVLAVSSATGFRPSEQPGSDVHDVRWLGVYLTWPPAPPP